MLRCTALTSQEIAKILREENLEVKVVDVKKKIQDISEFELVIVGVGLKMDKRITRVMIF